MEITGDVRWGILGCGDVCEVKSGPAFNKIDHSRLIAVMRRDREKAKDFARRHHVPKFYEHAEELIHDPEVNAVYIATPPASHEALAILAMEAGKPVYIEKPISVSTASCERMLQASQRLGVMASVAHYRRGLPIFNKLKALIQEGAIGRPGIILVRTLNPPAANVDSADYWGIDPEVSGGGLFFDLSPHQLDVFYWIFGQPQAVRAFSLNQRMRYEAPDMTVVDAVFPNNVCLHGIWAFNVSAAAEEETCDIIGDKGKLSFSFFKKSDIVITTDNASERLVFDYPENIQQPMIDQVAKFFRGEGPNPCSLEDALVTMKMMDASR
jgi:predicted dehydrogenase